MAPDDPGPLFLSRCGLCRLCQEDCRQTSVSPVNTFDVAIYLTGFVAVFYVAGLALEGKLYRKWRKVRRHQVTYREDA